jgi:short chain dehydrogenase/WD40-like Beta Propeller Repeat
MTTWRDQVALVTGGARGIGRATARLLAQRGAAVCVNYVAHADAAERLAAEIMAAGGRAIAAMANVAEAATVEMVVARAEKELGPVTILVNNAGMSWRGTLDTYDVATLDENGAIFGAARRIAGGPAESIFQPEWSPDGTDIVFVSDRSGWWNLYRFTLATGEVRPIAPRPAEFGQPQWTFGMATYAFAGPNRIVCAYAEAGLGHLAVIDLTTGSLRSLDTPFTQFASLCDQGDQAAFIAGASSHPASVVVFDLSSGRYRILKKATDILDRADLRIGDCRSSRSSFRPPPVVLPSACFIRHTMPITPRPKVKSRRYLSSATVVQPQPPPRHSTSASSTGRAAALRCLT